MRKYKGFKKHSFLSLGRSRDIEHYFGIGFGIGFMMATGACLSFTENQRQFDRMQITSLQNEVNELHKINRDILSKKPVTKIKWTDLLKDDNSAVDNENDE